jgi:hypothetical protein
MTRSFYHPREGKDSAWRDESTTPDEEYQHRYYIVEFPVSSTWVAMEGKMVVKKGNKLPGVCNMRTSKKRRKHKQQSVTQD